jgi:hypothetical protein
MLVHADFIDQHLADNTLKSILEYQGRLKFNHEHRMHEQGKGL